MPTDVPKEDSPPANPGGEKAQQAYQTSAKPAPPSSPEPDTPSSVKRETGPQDEKKYRLEKWRFALEFFTFIVLCIYTYVAYHQWQEMRSSTEAARKSADAATSAANTANDTLTDARRSFQVEQRPYVVASTPRFVEPLAVDKAPKVNVPYKDIGRTPAVRIRLYRRLVPYHAKVPITEQELEQWTDGQFRDLNQDFILDKRPKGARHDLAPGDSQFTTADTKGAVTEKEIEKLKDGTMVLFYMGIISYTDAYKGRYKTEFCYYFFGTDPTIWHICESHNAIE